MPDKPVQQLFNFDSHAETHAEAVGYKPSPEALDAIDRLDAWLTDPRTGRMTPVAEEAVESVRKALLEGKNSWWHKAEDMLEVLKLRNALTEGDDIPAGVRAVDGGDFHQTVEVLLDCLHQRFVAREAGGRSGRM